MADNIKSNHPCDNCNDHCDFCDEAINNPCLNCDDNCLYCDLVLTQIREEKGLVSLKDGFDLKLKLNGEEYEFTDVIKRVDIHFDELVNEVKEIQDKRLDNYYEANHNMNKALEKAFTEYMETSDKLISAIGALLSNQDEMLEILLKERH